MVYRATVSNLVVAENPVVVRGKHLVGVSHDSVVCQTPEYLIRTYHKRNPTGLSYAPARR
jgi:hypothetical protein